jgi:hypothetical protein
MFPIFAETLRPKQHSQSTITKMFTHKHTKLTKNYLLVSADEIFSLKMPSAIVLRLTGRKLMM